MPNRDMIEARDLTAVVGVVPEEQLMTLIRQLAYRPIIIPASNPEYDTTMIYWDGESWQLARADYPHTDRAVDALNRLGHA